MRLCYRYCVNDFVIGYITLQFESESAVKQATISTAITGKAAIEVEVPIC